jgi:telomerase reverse transcriptase
VWLKRLTIHGNTDTFKLQAHAMFLDTAFNSLNTVRENVYSAFVETATKMCAYIRCLPKSKKPGFMLMISGSL